MQVRAPRTLTSVLLLALLAAPLLAGSALAAGHDIRAAGAKPGKPTAKAPTGTITTTKPVFSWSKAPRAAGYELRVYKGTQLQLKKTGLKKTTWQAVKALPTNVALTWKVRASNAAGAGAWSRSLACTVAPPGPAKPLAIGDAYGGGIVAYIDGTGVHGLIAAAADQTGAGFSDGVQWALPAYQGADVPAAHGTAIGTGAADTAAIIAQNGAGTTYAAGLARAYTGGGYSDWYLPSRDELNELYVNRAAIGGFPTSSAGWYLYWSSSQHADFAHVVWSQQFDDGYQPITSKSYSAGRVRAVRTF
jgi:hypothetical protein